MAEVDTLRFGNQPPDGPDGGKGGAPGKKGAKKKETTRTRVSQACDRCRDRKDRCDGKKPSCDNCTTNGRECSYDTNVKKRGLPEGYVRGMEKLWGLAIKEVDDVEDELIAALGRENEQLALWNDESNAETLVGLWRKSRISQKLELLLSSMSLDSAENGKRKRDDSVPQTSRKIGGARDGPKSPTPQAGGVRDDWLANGILGFGMDMRHPLNAPSPTKFPPTNQPETILSPSSGHGQPLASTPAASSTTRIPDLPSETWHLLDVYFSYTHSWLPIIEKHDLLRISYQYSQHKPSSSETGSGDHAVLWAAIAYAKFQHRAINNIPRALGSVGEMVWTAERIYAQARAFIPSEEGPFEQGHVQALLILTLANMGTDHLNRAWFLIGQAVRIAIDLQLDHPLEHVLTASKSRSRAKHVYLGCFVLDTIVAARLGRRPHLRTSDIDVVGLLEEDGLEEWDPWADCLSVRRASTSHSRLPAAILSTFNSLVKILRVLNQACCATPKSPATTRQVSAELVGSLLAWTKTQPFPSHFDIDAMQSTPALSLLPHQYHLYTVYATTLAASHMISSSHGDESLEYAAKSARRTTDLLSQYSNAFGLLIVPPTYEFYIKTAYDIVNVIHGSINHTHLVINDWRRSLDYCLETVEPAWPVFETYRNSISSVSGLQRRESQVAFDLISGSNHSNTDAENPNTAKSPQSMNSYGPTSQASPRTASQSQPSRAEVFSSISSQRPSSFSQSSSHGLPQNPLNIYENAHAAFGMGNNSHLQNRESGQFSPSVQISRPNVQFRPHLRNSTSLSTDTDLSAEPVFGDLMRLDATEWTGNWDQSLVNLGFTDQDNPQAFYTFCQEPDPLQPNNVFQQLAANSAAETMSYLDNAAFGGLGIGMSGFEGFGFGEGHENVEGIEAGQILQALAAGEGQSGQQGG